MTPALINWQMKASFVLTVFVVILFGLDAGISVLIGLMSVVSGMMIGSRIAHRTSKAKSLLA